MRNLSTLSVVLILSLFAVDAASAQTGPELFLKPLRESDQFELNLDVLGGFDTETDNEDADGDDFDFRNDIYQLEGRVRLTDGNSQEGLARAQPRVGFSYTQVEINTNDPALPDDFVDTSAAIGMGIFSVDGWRGAISLGAGYASTDPDDANGLYFQGNLLVGKTFSNGVDTLGVVLDFNGNRSILPDVPLPGFQFRKKVGPTGDIYGVDTPFNDAIIAFGFPFSGIRWNPENAGIFEDRLTIDIQYLIPDNFIARIDYRVAGDTGLFLVYDSNLFAAHSEAFSSGSDRLLYRTRSVEGGLLYRYNDQLVVTLAGGYVLDSEFEIGFDLRDTDTLADIENYPYVRGGVELRL
ncbi:MAG: hypothetical protein AAGK78_07550 [Planctomycetota bacterium]